MPAKCSARPVAAPSSSIESDDVVDALVALLEADALPVLALKDDAPASTSRQSA